MFKSFFRKFFGGLASFFKKTADDGVSAYASDTSLFIIVSFFPFLMFLLTLLQFLPFSQKELMDDDTVYQLMARVTAGEEELALPLALAGVTEDGWYPITTFMIR